MSFLKRAIRDGISKGIGDAIGKAVQQAVEPAATKLANQASESLDHLAGQTQQVRRTPSGLEAAFGNLQRSMESYATEVSKNVKVCPSCGEPATADKTFCPGCGAKLPETTVAAGAVCPGCGKQNTVGTEFCTDCGTKLPAALEEENREVLRAEEVMDRWDAFLPAYPKWCCGGTPVDIQEIEPNVYLFTVDFKGNNVQARRAVEEYRQVVQRSGFHQAGQYPDQANLYKRVDGVCYHIDTEHCFDGDADCPTVGFDIREPYGGYDYVKPQPKPKANLLGLFK